MRRSWLIRVDATFDNSPARRGNPDPAADVYGGISLTRAAQGGG